MGRILPLRGAVQSYAWGSRTVLAELLGAPSPSPEPQAELWLGAHARAPALAWVDGGWTPLDRMIERQGAAILGRPSASRFGPRLPFLLKVLAVEQPLSLQAHPDSQQARAGFERERALAPHERVYADPHPKPELVCALGPFVALCGLRPFGAIRAHLERLGLEDLLGPRGERGAALRHFVQAWLDRRGEAASRVARAVCEAPARVADDPAAVWVEHLAAAHPGDPGALAPLFLHLFELAPGEALYLPAGELHCYLRGTAIEIMASSDNVLRGSLTPKAVHLDELVAVVRLPDQRPEVLEAEPRGPGERVWRTPAEEFELSQIDASPGAPAWPIRSGGVEILLCERGLVRIEAPGAPVLELARGASCLVPGGVGPYRVEGSGRLFRAALPVDPARTESACAS